MLLTNGTYIWDDEMKVPYLIAHDQWVGFDDERSIRNKMTWLKENGYGGAMIWTVDMDDFTGTVCGSGIKYPLITAMRLVSIYEIILQQCLILRLQHLPSSFYIFILQLIIIILQFFNYTAHCLGGDHAPKSIILIG